MDDARGKWQKENALKPQRQPQQLRLGQKSQANSKRQPVLVTMIHSDYQGSSSVRTLLTLFVKCLLDFVQMLVQSPFQ